jgi:alpha-1,2-glucosyltransferase
MSCAALLTQEAASFPNPEARHAALRAILGHLHRKLAPFLVAVLIVAHSLWVRQLTHDMRRYSDERAHIRQTQHLCEHTWQLEGGLAMLPGYHIISAALANATGDCSASRLRAFNMIAAWLATLTALGILSALHARRVWARTLSFHWLPIVFPYHFLAFTDVMALLPALWTVYFVVKRRWWAAGLVGTLAIGLRQTNVMLLLFVGLVALAEHDKSGALWDWGVAYLKKTWCAALGLLGFGLFVLINHGVAIGDRERHVLGVHVAPACFVLPLLFMAALPVNLENIWKQRARLRSPAFLLSLMAAGAIYMLYFVADHPFNSRPSCLRNKLLIWVMSATLHKALFFVPTALGFAALWVTPWARRSFMMVIPAALTILLPEGLVEHRYGILPIAFWMLLRRDGSATAEALTAVINGCVGTLLILLVLNKVAL